MEGDLRDLCEDLCGIVPHGRRAESANRTLFHPMVAQQKSKDVAKNLVAGLIKTCRQVQKHKGAAARW